jgi:hypothetical protein
MKFLYSFLLREIFTVYSFLVGLYHHFHVYCYNAVWEFTNHATSGGRGDHSMCDDRSSRRAAARAVGTGHGGLSSGPGQRIPPPPGQQ